MPPFLPAALAREQRRCVPGRQSQKQPCPTRPSPTLNGSDRPPSIGDGAPSYDAKILSGPACPPTHKSYTHKGMLLRTVGRSIEL